MDVVLGSLGNGPRGRRLVEELRVAILNGRLAPGERLPPSRALAAQLGVARGTVVGAYDELVVQGYCSARVGAGTFVTVVQPTPRQPLPGRAVQLSAWAQRLTQAPEWAPASEVRFDFRAGAPLEPALTVALGRALRVAVDGMVTTYDAGPAQGSLRLRRVLAAYLARARGVHAEPSNVIVVSGSQQGLDLATRLLVDPGQRVCVEEPGYTRARMLFEALGARIVPVPVDRDGICIDALPADGARLVYVTPSHQYPTGAVLAHDRRMALLAWARRHDAFLIEDDYDSEFRYSGQPLPALQGLDESGHCLYLGSLSKLLHPSLRIGYLVLPRALVAPAVAAKSTLDQATSWPVQEAMAELFERGEVERHLRRAMRGYRVRRGLLQSALERQLGRFDRRASVWPVSGGLHVFIEFRDGDAAAMQAAAAAAGVPVLTVPYGEGCGVVLWFGRLPPAQIEPAVAALAGAWADCFASAPTAKVDPPVCC